MKRFTLAAIAALVTLASTLSGCGYAIESTPLNAPPRAMRPREASAVDVYTSGRPNVAVHEVAMLSSEEESVYASGSESGALIKLRMEAGRMGCDGLVILGPTGNVSSGIPGSDSSFVRTLRGTRGTCILYAENVASRTAPVSVP